jgi:hypothetical protein
VDADGNVWWGDSFVITTGTEDTEESQMVIATRGEDDQVNNWENPNKGFLSAATGTFDIRVIKRVVMSAALDLKGTKVLTGLNCENDSDYWSPPIMLVPGAKLSDEGGLFSSHRRHGHGKAKYGDGDLTSDWSRDYVRFGFDHTSGHTAYWDNCEQFITGSNPYQLMVKYYPSGSTQTIAGSARIENFYVVDPNMQTTELSIEFDMPLTGPSGSSGWFCNAWPVKTHINDKWYVVMCENKTNIIHLYEIHPPGTLYAWN